MRPHPELAAPAALVCCLLATGCTADRPRAAHPSATPAPACPTSATIDAGNLGIPARQGTGVGVTFWALFFSASVTAGQEVKVVWRMTGSGDLTMNATGENGTTIKPAWGPEIHNGSSFQRPGDEWGTGWVFPTAGCWTVNATRTTGRAQMIIRVA
jgi:hypothetical protein